MAKKALLAALLLALVFAAPAWAQKADKTPTPVSGSKSAKSTPKDVRDFGTRWLGMSQTEKNAFMEGMGTAFMVVCETILMNAENKPKDNKEAQQRFKECMGPLFPYQPSDVSDAMTAIYQDKSNNNLSWDLIYGVALYKIKGTPYEDNLKQLRQSVSQRLKETP